MCKHIVARNYCGHISPYLGAIPCPAYTATLLLSTRSIIPFAHQTIRINTANCATDSSMKYEDVQLATCILCMRLDVARIFAGKSNSSFTESTESSGVSGQSNESFGSWTGRPMTDLTEGGPHVAGVIGLSVQPEPRASERTEIRPESSMSQIHVPKERGRCWGRE